MFLWAFAIFTFWMHFGVQALRFCTWTDKPAKVQIQQNDNSIKEKPISKRPRSETHNQSPDFATFLRKNEQFRSYQPHYLHSYSYPEPITPHIFIGQLNQADHFVFLVKNNETLDNKTLTHEIFYVNGKQQYGGKNLLNKPANLRIHGGNLTVAMVAQIENKMNIPVETRLIVHNFGNFLGIFCELYKDYVKSFIVYLSENGKRPVSIIDQIESQVRISFKNLGSFSNLVNWKYAHQPTRFRQQPEIKLANDSSSPNNFNSFAMIVQYLSIEAARKYKIAVREFPFYDERDQQQQRREFRSVQQGLNQMKQIKIDTFQYRFQVSNQDDVDSCQIKAERQLLQGLSYEYGALDLRNGSRPLPNMPKQLLSFSPSRKRFPWGFLWDDGFHCQVAVRSSPQLALKVIKSWLDTMHDFGWIPREQNRGPERQFLCSCPQFMAKDIKDGNPPTLLLALNFLARINVLNQENFPIVYWQKLQKWYKWFMNTQTAEKGSFIFRWHDSIQNSGSFNSGMDDFPRLPFTVGHVDCQAWMYFFAQTMLSIRNKLQLIGGTYQSDAEKIKNNLLEHFIDPSLNIFNDFSREEGKRYNPHFGYPSLLPIAFGMVSPTDEAFKATIAKFKQELDSGHGIASLSKKDDLYLATRDAYWRGPVWININYLFLRGLNIYYKSEMKLYKKLRTDLITTVCSQQSKKGYFYENYINGVGSFSYPFTGWTALISIIIRENY